MKKGSTQLEKVPEAANTNRPAIAGELHPTPQTHDKLFAELVTRIGEGSDTLALRGR